MVRYTRASLEWTKNHWNSWKDVRFTCVVKAPQLQIVCCEVIELQIFSSESIHSYSYCINSGNIHILHNTYRMMCAVFYYIYMYRFGMISYPLAASLFAKGNAHIIFLYHFCFCNRYHRWVDVKSMNKSKWFIRNKIVEEKREENKT